MGWLLVSPRLTLETSVQQGWLQKTPPGQVACTDAKALAQGNESVDQAWAGEEFLLASVLATLMLPFRSVLCFANLGQYDDWVRD